MSGLLCLGLLDLIDVVQTFALILVFVSYDGVEIGFRFITLLKTIFKILCCFWNLILESILDDSSVRISDSSEKVCSSLPRGTLES